MGNCLDNKCEGECSNNEDINAHYKLMRKGVVGTSSQQDYNLDSGLTGYENWTG